MKNLGAMMKQAQQMQSKMAEMQAALEQAEVTGQSGGGMIQIVMTAKGEPKRVKIDPSLVNPAEVEVLEDLIAAALRDARAKADAHVAEEMAKVTGGMSLPAGFKLPF
ncbi:YbaB/EbfC family nucleoid-associated protein [Dongia sp.]|uniref:YbaB/EbfC family nucleoid-associated protein n=1 Tax=Dongia sp. TaxID=1977262 RepID=UPI0035AFFBC3